MIKSLHIFSLNDEKTLYGTPHISFSYLKSKKNFFHTKTRDLIIGIYTTCSYNNILITETLNKLSNLDIMKYPEQDPLYFITTIENIFYKGIFLDYSDTLILKNNIKLEITETVNCLLNDKGDIITSSGKGQIICSPTLKKESIISLDLKKNKKIEIKNFLNHFKIKNEKIIISNYRFLIDSLPIKVIRGEGFYKLKCSVSLNRVKVYIPFKNFKKNEIETIKLSKGTIRNRKNEYVWEIENVTEKNNFLNFEKSRTTPKNTNDNNSNICDSIDVFEGKNYPIRIEFETDFLAFSGLEIRNVKMNSNSTEAWVRYKVVSGYYEVRNSDIEQLCLDELF